MHRLQTLLLARMFYKEVTEVPCPNKSAINFASLLATGVITMHRLPSRAAGSGFLEKLTDIFQRCATP